MKRLLALLLALAACGTQVEKIVNVEPSGLTAEDLPENCRRRLDIATNSGTAASLALTGSTACLSPATAG